MESFEIQSNPQPPPKSNTGLIIGGILAFIFFVGLIAFLVYWFVFRTTYTPLGEVPTVEKPCEPPLTIVNGVCGTCASSGQLSTVTVGCCNGLTPDADKICSSNPVLGCAGLDEFFSANRPCCNGLKQGIYGTCVNLCSQNGVAPTVDSACCQDLVTNDLNLCSVCTKVGGTRSPNNPCCLGLSVGAGGICSMPESGCSTIEEAETSTKQCCSGLQVINGLCARCTPLGGIPNVNYCCPGLRSLNGVCVPTCIGQGLPKTLDKNCCENLIELGGICIPNCAKREDAERAAQKCCAGLSPLDGGICDYTNCIKEGQRWTTTSSSCCLGLIDNNGVCSKPSLCASEGEPFSIQKPCCVGLEKRVGQCRKPCTSRKVKPTQDRGCCDGLTIIDGYCESPDCTPEGQSYPITNSSCCGSLIDINGICTRS